jgi:hypothetical protein
VENMPYRIRPFELIGCFGSILEEQLGESGRRTDKQSAKEGVTAKVP